MGKMKKNGPRLKRCPFCNSREKLRIPYRTVEIGGVDFSGYKVTCVSCCGSGATHPDLAEAINAWNKRAKGK